MFKSTVWYLLILFNSFPESGGSDKDGSIPLTLEYLFVNFLLFPVLPIKVELTLTSSAFFVKQTVSIDCITGLSKWCIALGLVISAIWMSSIAPVMRRYTLYVP